MTTNFFMGMHNIIFWTLYINSYFYISSITVSCGILYFLLNCVNCFSENNIRWAGLLSFLSFLWLYLSFSLFSLFSLSHDHFACNFPNARVKLSRLLNCVNFFSENNIRRAGRRRSVQSPGRIFRRRSRVQCDGEL